MFFYKIKTISLKKRVIYLMLVTISIQVIVLFNLINFTSIFDELYIQTYRFLSSQVRNTANNWSDLSDGITSNVSILSSFLSESLIDLAEENDMDLTMISSNEEVYQRFIELVVEYTMPIFSDDIISAAIVILDQDYLGDSVSQPYSTVFVRDREPSLNLSMYYPDLIQRTNEEVLTNNTHLLESVWIAELNPADTILTYENISLDNTYNMLANMVEEGNYANINQVGYWTDIFTIYQLDTPLRVMYYIIPLIDQNGKMFGAYGVELNSYKLSEIMYNYLHLQYYNEGFYILGRVEDNVLQEPYQLNRHDYLSVVKDNMPIIFEEHHLVGNEYSIRTTLNIDGDDQFYYVGIHTISMYQQGSLHEERGWALIGLSHESNIRNTYMMSVSSIYFYIVLASIFTLGIALFISSTTLKNLTGLSEHIKKFKGDKPFYFPKTNLKEIDELIYAIEDLNKTVLESSARISKILDMTKMPIGCFEDRYKSKAVFVTPKLFEILGIDPSKYPDSHIPKDEWDEIFYKILRGYNKTKKDVYKWEFEDDDLMFKWLKVESSIIDDRNIGIVIDVTEDMLKQQMLEYELDYDSMTRLLNKNSFKRIAAEKIADAPDKFGAMIFGDLDNLKHVNDTYGHEIGDKYIIAAADMFSIFKKLNGVIARMSGDEFGVYIHGFETIEDGRAQIYDYIENRGNKSIYLPDNSEMRIRASLGISWYGKDSKDLQLLIKYADYAMYETKFENKGGVMEFSKENYEKNIYLLEKGEALNKLIDGKLIKYAFQPIIDLKNGEIYGYEALMRPLIDEFTSPREVLSVASVQSKLYQIEKVTINLIIDWILENKERVGRRKIFFNISSNQMLNKQDLSEVMDKMLQASNNIVYEVTEGGYSESHILTEKSSILRSEARSMLALDNFGTGYFNEFIILSVNPDIIKLDKDIVNGIASDKDKQKVVKNLISYCKKNNVLVIAEGVETEEELITLMKFGVDMAQGYYFGYPSFELQESITEEKRNIILSYRDKFKG